MERAPLSPCVDGCVHPSFLDTMVQTIQPEGPMPDLPTPVGAKSAPDPTGETNPPQIYYGWIKVPIEELWTPKKVMALPPGLAQNLGYDKACRLAVEFNEMETSRRKHRWAVVSAHIAQRKKFGVAVVTIPPGTRPDDPRQFPVQIQDITGMPEQLKKKVASINRAILEYARVPRLWAIIAASMGQMEKPKPQTVEDQMRSPCVRCGEPIGMHPHYIVDNGFVHAECEEAAWRRKMLEIKPP